MQSSLSWESSGQGCKLALVPYGQMQLNLRPNILKKPNFPLIVTLLHLLHTNVGVAFYDFYTCIVLQFAQNCINDNVFHIRQKFLQHYIGCANTSSYTSTTDFKSHNLFCSLTASLLLVSAD